MRARLAPEEITVDTKDIEDWGHRLRKVSPDQMAQAVQSALGQLVDCELEATVASIDYGEGVFGKATIALTITRKAERSAKP
jgi:hypothetical protein